jgi:hypothetical protein
MLQRKVEVSLMVIGVGAMGVGGVVPSVAGVGVFVTSSMGAIEFLQLLNLDSLNVNQTQV